MSVYTSLIESSKKQGAAYAVLIDPDKIDRNGIPAFAQKANDAQVDAIFIGGSLIVDDSFEKTIVSLKEHTNIPVIIFPGGVMQISSKADAILFLSIISGRNPEHLIGNQVLAAPIVRKIGLEAISTAYVLVESGKTTSAEFMSNTRPLPRHKPDIAVAHAMAAEILGFKLIYLEAGSGAEFSIPEEMIAAISMNCNVPMIVGGGITNPELASMKVKMGASIIVTGNVLEKDPASSLMHEFAQAIHNA